MTPPLTFRTAAAYEPGLVYALLAQCYADILDAALAESLRTFDAEVWAAPDTVGACTLISSLNDEIVGLVSYDPRQGPQVGLIGHNGVLPARQRQGYGTEQIREVIRLLASRQFARVGVSTSAHPFFAPARRMYEKCGLREIERIPGHSNGPYAIIHYEKALVQ